MDNPSGANVYLDNEPFNVRSYQRGTTNDLVARFGSAEKGQTNLDLLKAETQMSFRGGMFQRLFDDPEAANTITGAYFNEMDGNLYFSPDWTSYQLALSNNPSNITAWCVYERKYLFIAYKTDYVTPGNKIARIDITTGAVVAVTVPAGVTNAICPITSMVTHKDAIFFCGATWQNTTAGWFMNIHRITTLTGTPTVTDIGGVCYELFTFREKLYLISHLNVFFGANNEFGSVTYDVLKQTVGQGGVESSGGGGVEFNGALYFGKQDGLYRFDGVTVLPVIDYRKNPNARNFKNLCMMNGRLYYTMGNKLYRFDGANIEMVQDFSAGYVIVNMTAGVDRLWITTRNSQGVPYSDKFGSGIDYQHSVFCFNGVGFFEYQTFLPPTGQEQRSPIAIQIGDFLNLFYPDLWINGSLEVRTNFEHFKRIDLNNEYSNTNIGSNRSFTVFSSEMDNKYPAVPKTLNGVMVEYQGLEASKTHLKLEAMYFADGVWGSWVELWNELNVAAAGVTNDYRLHEESLFASPNLTQPPSKYNKVRYKLTCSIDNGVTLTDVPRVRSVSLRYTLQPNIKKRWLLGLSLYGKDNRDINDVTVGDQKETRHSNQLRKIIYDALVNKKPILFYDADYSEVKTISGSIKIKGTHQVSSGDVLAIEDTTNSSEKWINRRLSGVSYDTGNDETTIVLDQVGLRRVIGGSTASTVAVGAEVRPSYAVYVTRISNERYILDENTLNNLNGYTDIPSDIVVELQEV